MGNDKELIEVLEEMLESVASQKGIITKQNKLLWRKQLEDETISMWGIKVERELRKMGAVEYTMCDTFAHGIRDRVVREKMIKKLVLELGT